MEITEILPGDVLFVWGDSPIDDAIEFVTHGPSHVAIFLDSENLAEAQAFRKSGNALISEYLAEHDKKLEVWRDETLTEEGRAKIVEYAKKHFGIHYDYLVILAELARFELDIPINSFGEGKRRICSSYVNDCGKSVNRNWANVPYAPAPIDLLKGGKLTRKGELSHVQ